MLTFFSRSMLALSLCLPISASTLALDIDKHNSLNSQFNEQQKNSDTPLLQDKFLPSQIPSLSVQLHSVRDSISKDFKSTIAALAKTGIDGVELAGRYGPFADKPKELKAFLASQGLKISGAHAPLSQLIDNNGDKIFKFFKDAGVTLVIIPYDKRANNPNEIDGLVQDLNTLASKANTYGISIGYHNHSSEFEKIGDITFWDYLAQNTHKSVVLQLDVGWAIYAGIDPIAIIKRYPNRTITTHYKIRTYKGKPSQVDSGTRVILGSDDYDWLSLITATIEYGGTQWIVVEQEEYPTPLSPLQSVEASIKGISTVMEALKTK